MPGVYTSAQLSEVRWRRIYHRCPPLNHSYIEYCECCRPPAQENTARYSSSQAPPQGPFPLLDLTPELLGEICNSLDITKREDIDALTSLAQTCRTMNLVVTDSARIRASFRLHCPLQARVLSDVCAWNSLRHMRALIRHTDIFQRYITTQIGPHMQDMDTIITFRPFDLPHSGWQKLLWTGELIRVKIMGLQVLPTPNIEVVQSLTPAELLALMYSVIIFQGYQEVQGDWKESDTTRADRISAAGSGFNYLKALRTHFMMGGPREALKYEYGVGKYSQILLGNWELFDLIALPVTLMYENELGNETPRAGCGGLLRRT